MDFDSYPNELFPMSDYGGQIFLYNNPLLVSGVMRAVVTEDLGEIKNLIRSGKSVNINDINGNTPLHVAVIKRNLNIVKYLVAEETTDINARNFLGQTPLFIAVKSGRAELAQCLVDNGANVNLPNAGYVTPLHISIRFPNIAHLLIKSGANIDVSDYCYDSPLHDAISLCSLETVCMFLYYNADANRRGDCNLTPFMKALISENENIQEVLFGYVDDFNVSTLEGISTLALALTHRSHFVEEIIKKGAKVDESAYRMCIMVPNPANFKLVWKNLPPEEAKYYVRLEELCSLMEVIYMDESLENHFPAYMDIILEDTNDSILDAMAERLNNLEMALIISSYAEYKWNLDTLTKFIYLMLQHGFQLSSYIIYEVFVNYGYCELFKLFLFTDYVSEWCPYMYTSRFIFDIRSNIKTECREIPSVRNGRIHDFKVIADAKHFFHYWNYRPLIDLIQRLVSDDVSYIVQNLPKLPSLLELARNKTREHIVEKLNLSTASQYYTVVNLLNIAPFYKKILMFEQKLYI